MLLPDSLCRHLVSITRDIRRQPLVDEIEERGNVGLRSFRSLATSRQTYSAKEIPSSAALARARRCTSGSSVICVLATIVAPSFHHH